ncbi:unnamed protein product, partial [Ectocarpus fasciculatus]
QQQSRQPPADVPVLLCCALVHKKRYPASYWLHASMLSLALARRVRCRQSGQAARLTRAAGGATRGVIRQRLACVTASATTDAEKQQQRQGNSPSRSPSSLWPRSAAKPSWTRHETTPRWTLISACLGDGIDLGGVRGSGCGGGGGGSSSGWRNRRQFCGVAATAGSHAQDGEAAAETDAGAATAAAGGTGPGRAAATSVSGEGSDEISTRGGGEGHQEARSPNQPRRRPQAAAQPKKGRTHPFGKPLCMLASGSTGFGAGSGAFDIEDELPDLSVVEVAGHGDEPATMGTKELRERMTACPEVVVALSRGLSEGRARVVADNLCAYASTKRTAESTLAQLERLLGRRPHQVEWALPLIRAQLMEESRPSWETHREQLSCVREINIQEVGLEDMAEIMLRGYARHKWGPDMTREEVRNEHPERWEEAMTVSEKLADRLPVCRYQLVWRVFYKFLEAKKTRRRQRVLGELATVLGTRA